MADLLAVYGLKTFETLTYDLYVGLKMNLPRVRMQAVWAIMQGLKAASAKQLPDSLFDAVAPSEDAAADMAMDANLELSRIEAARTARGMMG